MRVRFMLYSIEQANRINRKFVWVGERLSRIFFKTQYDLERAGLDITAEKYLTAAFFSAQVYGALFSYLFYALFFLRDGTITPQNSALAFAIGLAFFAVFFILHVIYPRIKAQKYASGIDNSLLFALKSMLIQVSSGVSLFDAMVNVSKSRYGTVSREFEATVKAISAGVSQSTALEKLALSTKSLYLKRTSWQLLSSLRSGASLEGALSSVVQNLASQQMRAIKNYAAELNMWILVYLLLAAALPALGITFLVILSAMGGASIGPPHVLAMVAGAFVLQILLITFVKTRIPKVYA